MPIIVDIAGPQNLFEFFCVPFQPYGAPEHWPDIPRRSHRVQGLRRQWYHSFLVAFADDSSETVYNLGPHKDRKDPKT